MYLDGMALVEFRRCLPIAQLTATVLNFAGGKGQGEKPLDTSKYFTAFELLPAYARPDGLDLPDPYGGISPATAKAFLALSSAGKLPGWVIAVAPVEMIRRAATAS